MLLARILRTVGVVSGNGPSSKVSVTRRRPLPARYVGPSATIQALAMLASEFSSGHGRIEGMLPRSRPASSFASAFASASAFALALAASAFASAPAFASSTHARASTTVGLPRPSQDPTARVPAKRAIRSAPAIALGSYETATPRGQLPRSTYGSVAAVRSREEAGDARGWGPAIAARGVAGPRGGEGIAHHQLGQLTSR